MTTIGVVAAGFKAARAASAEARAQRRAARANKAKAAVNANLSVAAELAGLGCVTAAAWTVAMALGLLAAGVSFFVVAWQVNDE